MSFYVIFLLFLFNSFAFLFQRYCTLLFSEKLLRNVIIKRLKNIRFIIRDSNLAFILLPF